MIDFEYLQDKGIEMAMSNRAILTRRTHANCGNKISIKKRRAISFDAVVCI